MPMGYDIQVTLGKDTPYQITLRARKRAIDLSTMELIRNLKINSPVDHGKLQGSWFKTPDPGPLSRRVKSAAKYAQSVNDGTGIYGPTGRVIRPKVGRLLGPFRYMGRMIAVPWIRGQKGQHFVEKSITQTERRNDEFIIRAVMESEGQL